MGDKLMPLVIQYTAALYRLFWYEVHPEDRPLMPAPAGQEIFSYAPTVSPVVDGTASHAKPVGLGYIAKGGDTLTLKISLPEFATPVDIYFGYYAPSTDRNNIYVLTSSNSFVRISVLDPLNERLLSWKSNISSPVNESPLGNISISSLPPGTYTAYLLVAPAGSLDSYYLWSTSLEVTSPMKP